MRKVLVFGIGGFVGSYLAAELIMHGFEVVGAGDGAEIDIPCVPYSKCDITDYASVQDLVRDERPDFIIDLAAVSSVGVSWNIPKTAFDVNVGGAINILESVRNLGLIDQTTVLLIGSSEQYATSEEPLKESDPLDALSPYGVSKLNQEYAARLYSEGYGLRIVRTRAFNHTGPGQPETFVLPSFCKQTAEIAAGTREPIIHVGNIEVVRDFSDVRDVVRAYRMLLEGNFAGEVFNVGYGKAHRIGDLLSKIIVFAGQQIDIVVDKSRIRPNETRRIEADISKIKEMVGWEPLISIEDTLLEIYREVSLNSERRLTK